MGISDYSSEGKHNGVAGVAGLDGYDWYFPLSVQLNHEHS